jgi:hypothetical protein
MPRFVISRDRVWRNRVAGATSPTYFSFINRGFTEITDFRIGIFRG